MEKRLTQSDYLFVLLFIFMLVAALGAFFFGLKLGNEKASARYEVLLAKLGAQDDTLNAYQQQYLVSFYHTIYQPYREFHQRWFDSMSELAAAPEADASRILKQLSKLAADKYDELGKKSMPASSPLLADALADYRRSLKLFAEGLDGAYSKADAAPASALVGLLTADPHLTEAKSLALKAEERFYAAIVKWNESQAALPSAPAPEQPLAFQDWNGLGFNMKADYVAQWLVRQNAFHPFTPHDAVSRADELIASGQASRMNLTEVGQVLELLIATDAVRPGDFMRYKSRYAGETLPQLPFYTE